MTPKQPTAKKNIKTTNEESLGEILDAELNLSMTDQTLHKTPKIALSDAISEARQNWYMQNKIYELGVSLEQITNPNKGPQSWSDLIAEQIQNMTKFLRAWYTTAVATATSIKRIPNAKNNISADIQDQKQQIGEIDQKVKDIKTKADKINRLPSIISSKTNILDNPEAVEQYAKDPLRGKLDGPAYQVKKAINELRNQFESAKHTLVGISGPDNISLGKAIEAHDVWFDKVEATANSKSHEDKMKEVKEHYPELERPILWLLSLYEKNINIDQKEGKYQDKLANLEQGNSYSRNTQDNAQQEKSEQDIWPYKDKPNKMPQAENSLMVTDLTLNREAMLQEAVSLKSEDPNHDLLEIMQAAQRLENAINAAIHPQNHNDLGESTQNIANLNKAANEFDKQFKQNLQIGLTAQTLDTRSQLDQLCKTHHISLPKGMSLSRDISSNT